MHPVLTFAVLLAISSLPAVFPRRKHAAIGLVLVFGLWIAGGVYLLNDLKENPSGGDGPAFFAISFLIGAGQLVVLLSFAGRVLAEVVVSALAPASCRRVMKWLLCVPLVFAAFLVLYGHEKPGFIALLGLAAAVGFPSLWMSMTMKLVLDYSFRQSPLRA